MKKRSETTENEQVLSVSDTADRLGCSIRHVWKLIYDRKIAHVRIGRRRGVTTSALKDFLDQNTVPAQEANTGLRAVLQKIGPKRS